MSVSTPYLNGLIDGTEFALEVGPSNATLMLLEGHVRVANASGQVALSSGQMASAAAGAAPVQSMIVSPRDAVQWAIHFPAMPAGQDSSGPASEAIRASLDAARRGDLEAAFAALDRVDPSMVDAGFLVHRAALLLRVGRVEEARADVGRALALAPGNSAALTVRSVIATATGRVDDALVDAQSAVQSAPRSSAAYVALSYAQQSRFDLPAAYASIEKATDVEPSDAIAWARRAELASSFGGTEDALAFARRASELDPAVSRSQTVLGFGYLLRSDARAAEEAFRAAIALDQADPYPHLGLGLALISTGDLATGRAELDVAVSLDPNRSLLRSYLGKAYFEERREDLYEQQFDIARQLDPQDPTPWLYSAIALQATNRPGEALQALQQSIALNDNRAVYRSRLLLDSDLAARSASLARVYADLGFQQLALVEGWHSVAIDPTNFSSHRFLADSYSALSRHEIARVSELLQSQLLQPVSLTPIQPRLGESDLFLAGSGAAAGPLSFNEFGSLFTRDGLSTQASAILGGDATRATEGVVSGVHDDFSFSLGAFHYETGGYRDNGDQIDDILVAFVQYALSPDTSVQAEYRYRDAERGDLQQRFFASELYPGQRSPLETHNLRVGLRHDFSPASTVLVSVVHSDAEFGAFDTAPFVALGFITFIGVEDPQKATGLEVQHLFRGERFNLTWGGGYFDRSGTSRFTIRTSDAPPDDVIPVPDQDADLKHSNAYAYGSAELGHGLTLVLGVSAEHSDGSDDVEAGGGGTDVNPKVGLLWTPGARTHVRAAAFRATKRPVISNQTIEPTQVAGFNQFFDDFNATRSWRYGLAVDHQLGDGVFIGGEATRRDQDVPATDQFGEGTDARWEDMSVRGYALWSVTWSVALRAEVEHERLTRDIEITDGFKRAKTTRVPLGLTWNLPSGFGGSVLATFVRQEGVFESIFDATLRDGEDSFCVVDISFRYRLPALHGFVSVGISNLLDEDFRYFDTDFVNPRFRPERIAFGSLTLALP